MHAIQRFLAISATALGLALPGGVWAQAASDAAAMSPSTAATAWTEGEVKKIDTERGKVTLKHGPIENLGMPAMTMVFTAKDRSQLATLKPGDKVQFVASDENGKLAVDQIQPAQ